MRKRKNTFIILLLILILIINSSYVVTATSKVSKSPITFTYWCPWSDSEITRYVKSFADSITWKEIFKRTNVTLKFIHPPYNQETESFNLMIASGDLPDMINTNNTYPGGWDKAIEDGIIIDLKTYIDKYAPNIKQYLKDTEIRRVMTSDEGHIPALYQIYGTPQPPWYGPMLRKDWLDELKLKVPETYDEWYQVLKAFKTKKNAIAPLMMYYKGGFDPFTSGSFYAGFDVSFDFINVNGKLKYSPLEKGFKEYLSLMNKWYKEGLIDKDFYTRKGLRPDTSYVTTGKAGAWSGLYNMMSTYKHMANDPKYELISTKLPVKKIGQKLHVGLYVNKISYSLSTSKVLITKKCKNPKAAIEFWDYFYTKEGSILANYGIKDKTYTIKKGKFVLSDLIAKNPAGMSANTAMRAYITFAQPGIYLWERELSIAAPEEVDAIKKWGTNNDFSYLMPPVTLLQSESNRFAQIITDINTYVEELVIKSIIGAYPLDKYDTYIKKIKSMGINEALSIQQKALDRFYNRK